MAKGTRVLDERPATYLQLLALSSITASYPTIFLFVMHLAQSPFKGLLDSSLYSIQEIGADSAVILIGISFFLASAGDLIVSPVRPKYWLSIIALFISSVLILLLLVTASNQVRAGLQNKLFLIRWIGIQCISTILALVYGAILKAASQDASR